MRQAPECWERVSHSGKREVQGDALPLLPKNTYEWQTIGLMRKTGAEELWNKVEEAKEVKEAEEKVERGGYTRAVCKSFKEKGLRDEQFVRS
ncbi:MAG: hypothetical protein PVS2B2_17560 [Candidatus Acidiferrum sp.]